MKIAQMLALAMMLGSIPFKHIATQYVLRNGKKRDVCDPHESGILGGPLLAAVLLLSVAQGFIPTYLTKANIDSYGIVILAGAIAVLSNCFPYWLIFRPSGKGLPLGLGVLIALNPAAGASVLGVWMLAMLLFNRLSAAAMIASFSAPIWLRIFNSPSEYMWFALAGCVFVILAHSSNLSRLIDGTEPKYRQ